MKPRVRFAPSPTGMLHIGSARTALFNYVFAQQHDGEMILRIEDTDINRDEEKFVDDIISDLDWLGLNWSEKHRQSEREDIYKDMLAKLKSEGKVYEKEGAQWLEVDSKVTEIEDLIQGQVSFPDEEMEDFVIFRSDGTPVFHFTNVVDDALMDVTHIIRGDDHLSNVPRHLALYEALDFEPPQYAHIPLIHNQEGGKMSKRDDQAVALTHYRRMGYLPEAMVNFLALLGWAPDDERDFFSMDELIQEFEISDIKASPAAFDLDKLNYINHHYLQELSMDEYMNLAQDFIQDWPDDPEWRRKALSLFKDRAKYLAELKDLARPIFSPPDYEPELLIFDRSDYKKTKKGLELAQELLEGLEASQWNADDLQTAIENEIEDTELSPGDIFWPIRAALSGKEASPPPQELLDLLGKDESLNRIKTALKKLNELEGTN